MIKAASIIPLLFLAVHTSADSDINPKILINPGAILVPERKDSPLFYDGFYTKDKIEIKPFYIQKYEVTYKEFFNFAKKYVKTIPKNSKIEELNQDDWLYQYEKGEDEEKKPVSSISFFFATKYCDSIGGRVPTEAEWISAASFATHINDSYPDPELNTFYPFSTKTTRDENDSSIVVNSYITDVAETAEGISGVNGMSGSLWEMTSDYYPVYHSEKRDAEKIIIKGGSFLNAETPIFFDSRLRNFIFKNQHGAGHVGFRCAFEGDQ